MQVQGGANQEAIDVGDDLDISTAFDGKELKAFTVEFSEMEVQILRLANNNESRKKRLFAAGLLNWNFK